MTKIIARALRQQPAVPDPPAPTSADLRAEVHAVHEVFPYCPPDDPRPDLFVDADDWQRLLKTAWLLPGAEAPDSLFWALEATRCLGAALIVDGNSAKIRRGQMPEAEYEQVRCDWLAPRLAELRPLMEDRSKWAK